jgi:hypothetical protein
MKAIWRTTVVFLAALALGVMIQTAAAGEKIEFSPPAQPRVLKPLTEQDLRGRAFNFQKAEAPAARETSVNAMLPTPQSMNNRVRALESLVERAGAVGGLFEDDGGLMLPGTETELGIDDLFQGVDSLESSSLDTDNEGMTASERENMARKEEFMRMRRAAIARSNENQNRPDGSEAPFLPALNFEGERGDRVLRDALGRPQAGFLERGRILEGASMGFGTREAIEKREQQMEDFRRLLGTAPGSETSSDFVGNAVIGTSGGPPVPGAPRGTSILDRSAPAMVSDPLAASRTLDALRSSQPSLDLNSGARASNPLAPDKSFVPPPRPMDLFRQKHDARIPARVF